ncbi:isopenicillin N synthase family oxygenase [Streptomyces sp. WAC05374]|uniref:isopenicillin N synthase family dioxygenase n=1 Tax=Streptomyces sp. WAC05374 TaxID=2487420 RepID=UPI0010541C97|nr:2-oxoglutarate and iron-dependent oxygenase domain-containing protein [Streptomyces sp. WAC05374]TDF40430.1 isopenicillin N synthase family oxygenase [Streptomyces sp. WAC05374]TDF49064.1 isopenicillin N synthase family oxygenase [Streptomyces sp. WAC05374]TDF49550.1 isopenicillin N synthase family oxygenase [Streptomyces sp. WAC05374]
MSEPTIPVVDLAPWLSGGPAARAATARTVDRALRTAGFLLVTGHGVEPALRAAIREEARRFFRLDARTKQPYAVRVGGRGWLGPGAEANAYAEGSAGPPDLKESLSFASHEPTGDPAVDAEWFLPNTWPAEVPGLRPPVEEYLARMRELSDLLLELLGTALGEGEDFFTRHTAHPTWGFNINWYPGRDVVGDPEPGQFRIGPHTDFGTVTVLDRQAGRGGLQVFTDERGWEDAPYDPDALTVNIGDLMSFWTDGRWRPGRHRVLPPPADAPREELMSLVYFYECDPGTDVRGTDSHTYLRAQLDAITTE